MSDILQMRICQRESRNKDFYDSYQQAAQRLRRIDETSLELTPRQQRRMVYARSEYRIVASAYFYYVGLDRQSAQAISGMGEEDLVSDTAQLINYWYCYGAGGLLTKGSREEIYQQEFDCLMRAYRLAMESRSTFWIANTLQALSEHLLQRPDGPRLMADNPRDIRLINTDAMPDSLLAGNLAEPVAPPVQAVWRHLPEGGIAANARQLLLADRRLPLSADLPGEGARRGHRHQPRPRPRGLDTRAALHRLFGRR